MFFISVQKYIWPILKKKKKKPCFLKSRSFCSCFCMCLPNLGDQIQNWEGRRFYLISIPLEWSSSFLLKYPGRQWSSLRKYLTIVHLHEPVKAICILDEDIGAHSCPFWICFQLRSCLCWESTPSSFWLRGRTRLQSLSLYWLAWTSLVKRKEDVFMFWSCFDSTWRLSFPPNYRLQGCSFCLGPLFIHCIPLVSSLNMGHVKFHFFLLLLASPEKQYIFLFHMLLCAQIWIRPVVLIQSDFSPKGMLAMPGSIFGRHDWGGGSAI